jgi:hypothetical protein
LKRKKTPNNNISHSPFLILLCSLLFCTCDLFNGATNPDFLKNIDDEIAWSNAKRLDVRVDYNPLWGSSPQQGALDRETHRQGFAFDVEFTPTMGYGFVGLFAFRTNGLDLTKIDVNEALNGNGVEIEDASKDNAMVRTYKVKINITDPVTLVPLCSDRPRLSQRTNPPLNQTLLSFPCNQRINIWFNMPVKRDDLIFGKEKITISGHYLIGNIGAPFQGREDGDIQEYFQLEFPPYLDSNSFVDQVMLLPKEQNATILAYLLITVKVGTDIKNEADIPMAQAESVSFMTDSSEAENVFLAYNIKAQAADGQWFGDNQLFNNPKIDRRYLPGETLSVSFDADYISQNIPLNMIRITEQMVCNLDGSPLIDEPLLSQDYYNFTYDKNAYTFNYRVQTERSGIIQLLVLPWNLPSINPLKPDAATLQGRYVTIVVDGESPDLTNLGEVTISNHSRIDDVDKKLYLYGGQKAREGVIVTIKDLGGIRDNIDGGGISFDDAWRYPWTKNDKELYWQVMIGKEGEEGTITSDWLALYNNSGGLNNQWQSSAIINLEHENGYPVFVQFKDRPGNKTGWKNTENSVKYKLFDDTSPATNLKAECNTAGNAITVTWMEPNYEESPGYLNPQIEITTYKASSDGDKVEGETTTYNLSRGTMSYTIRPPAITTNGVLTGGAVSGVYGYEIAIISYDNNKNKKTNPLWVYNIPGMTVTETNTVRITESGPLTVAAGDLGKNIILTRDITVSAHTPINNFTGKFYGNGHTITINGMNNSSANMGLFGIASNALIRDLTVSVNNATISYSGTAQVFIGGITGQANNSTQISNCRVNGTLNVSSAYKIHAGGIAGSMNPDALAENCYSGINLSVTETGNDIICAGGIAGQIWHTQTVASTKLMINKVTAVGNVTATNNGTGSIYLGGILGECRGRGLIQDTVFSGTLTMTATSATAGATTNYICGGIVGRMQEGNLLGAKVTGRVTVPTTNYSAKEILLGGIVGTAGHDRALADTNGAKITVKNATVENTAATNNISLSAYASGTVTMGGVCAASSGSSSANNIVFENCEYNGGSAGIYMGNTNSGLAYIGGFIGDVKQNTSFIKCRTIMNTGATGLNIEYRPGSTKNIELYAGGFVGRAVGSPLEELYSNCPIVINIRAFQDAHLNVGGFVGLLQQTDTVTALSIKRCFARGSVTVNTEHTGSTKEIYTGGFGGYIKGKVSIENSYTTGAVRVDKKAASSPIGPIKTGGFVGLMEGPASNNRSTINRCFTAGDVVSLYNWTGEGPKRINEAGGFAGGLGSTDVTQCVVASGNIWAQGGDVQAKRFVPAYGNCVLGNLANTAIRVYGHYTYNTTLQTGVTVVASGDYNGGDVSPANLNLWSWWSAASGQNFSSTIWNSGNQTRGYPLLLNMSGQE